MANETLGGMWRIFGGRSGTWICNGASAVTVANPLITANSVVVTTIKTVGGTVSATMPNVKTITPGVGFTISGLASDTSTYNYTIIRQDLKCQV